MTETATKRDPETGRSLHLNILASPDGFSTACIPPGRYFVAMLVCDATRLRDSEISVLSRKLIDAGCAYLCCWGSGCERVHDLFDAAWIENEFDPQSSNTIMTTWHSDDSLDEFTHFAIRFTEPTEKYLEQCGSVVAIVIDDVRASDRIQQIFSDPAGFYATRALDS